MTVQLPFHLMAECCYSSRSSNEDEQAKRIPRVKGGIYSNLHPYATGIIRLRHANGIRISLELINFGRNLIIRCTRGDWPFTMLLHCLVLLSSSILACGAAITRFSKPPQLPNSHTHPESKDQHLLVQGAAHQVTLHAPSGYLDAAPNTVGLLLTLAESDGVEHLWLPLGRKIYTRESTPPWQGAQVN